MTCKLFLHESDFFSDQRGGRSACGGCVASAVWARAAQQSTHHADKRWSSSAQAISARSSWHSSAKVNSLIRSSVANSLTKNISVVNAFPFKVPLIVTKMFITIIYLIYEYVYSVEPYVKHEHWIIISVYLSCLLCSCTAVQWRCLAMQTEARTAEETAHRSAAETWAHSEDEDLPSATNRRRRAAGDRSGSRVTAWIG